MALKYLYDQSHNQFDINNGEFIDLYIKDSSGNAFLHSVNSGIYNIQDSSGNVYLNFNNGVLGTSTVKNYVDNVNNSLSNSVNVINNNQTTHQNLINSLQNTTAIQSAQITALQSLSGETITGNINANENHNFVSWTINNSQSVLFQGKIYTDFTYIDEFNYNLKSDSSGNITVENYLYKGSILSGDQISFTTSTNVFNLFLQSVNATPFTCIIRASSQNL
jgi:hypothetical protein